MSGETTPRLEFIESFIKAQKEFKAVERTSKNPYLKSTYAPYEEVHRAVMPALNKYGFMVSHRTEFTNNLFVMVTTITHVQGHEISSVHVIEKTTTMQDKGSGETYAKRYNLIALTGVPVVNEDDDGENEKYVRYKEEAQKILSSSSGNIKSKFQSFIGRDNSIDDIDPVRYQALCEWLKKEISKEASNVVS